MNTKIVCSAEFPDTFSPPIRLMEVQDLTEIEYHVETHGVIITYADTELEQAKKNYLEFVAERLKDFC